LLYIRGNAYELCTNILTAVVNLKARNTLSDRQWSYENFEGLLATNWLLWTSIFYQESVCIFSLDYTH